MGIYGHEIGLNLMCIKLSPEEGVVMEVVVKIYLVSPGPARDHYAFWGCPDVRHVVKTRSAHIRGLSHALGDSVKRITSRRCGGVRERSASAW